MFWFYPFTPLYNICQIVAVMVSGDKGMPEMSMGKHQPRKYLKQDEQACGIRILNNIYTKTDHPKKPHCQPGVNNTLRSHTSCQLTISTLGENKK